MESRRFVDTVTFSTKVVDLVMAPISPIEKPLDIRYLVSILSLEAFGWKPHGHNIFCDNYKDKGYR